MNSYNILDRCSNKSDRCLWILAKVTLFLAAWQRQSGNNSPFLFSLFRQQYRRAVYSLVNRIRFIFVNNSTITFIIYAYNLM